MSESSFLTFPYVLMAFPNDLITMLYLSWSTKKRTSLNKGAALLDVCVSFSN